MATWNSRTSGTTQDLFGTLHAKRLDCYPYNLRRFIVGGNGTIRYSPNGLSWTPTTSTGTTETFRAIADNGSTLLAVGLNGAARYNNSGTGVWADAVPGTSTSLYGCEWDENDSLFIVVGAGGLIRTCDENISNWTPRTSGTSENLYAVAHSGSLCCVVGSNGTILTSPDGISWTSRTSGTGVNLFGVHYAASLGLWVAVGNGGVLLTSANGTSWVSRSSSTAQDFRAVGGDPLILAVGKLGVIQSSLDGINWNSDTSGSSVKLNGVCQARNETLVVGDGGELLASLGARMEEGYIETTVSITGTMAADVAISEGPITVTTTVNGNMVGASLGLIAEGPVPVTVSIIGNMSAGQDIIINEGPIIANVAVNGALITDTRIVEGPITVTTNIIGDMTGLTAGLMTGTIPVSVRLLGRVRAGGGMPVGLVTPELIQPELIQTELIQPELL